MAAMLAVGVAVGAATLAAGGPATAAAPVERDFTIAKATPSLAVTATPPAGSTSGGSVALTATLTGASTPTGSVNFTVNGVTTTGCGTQPVTTTGGVSSATCTTSALPAGSDTLAAVYTGDANNWAATAPSLSYGVTTPPPAATTCDGFSDVAASNQFCADITWAKDHRVTTGNTDGTFTPAAPVVRDAMAGFLYRYEHPGITAPACTSAPFTDVTISDVFCGDIAALKAEGVLKGNRDGTFSPAVAVSRQTMAAFLTRIGKPGNAIPGCTTAPFRDVPVTNVFCGDITALVALHVTGGYPDGGYHPTTVVARQEMAAFLHRLYDNTH